MYVINYLSNYVIDYVIKFKVDFPCPVVNAKRSTTGVPPPPNFVPALAGAPPIF